MRILNRVIVAGALVVPMGLGVSGIAVADVPADSSVLRTQIAASENDDLEDCDKDGLFGLFGLFGGGNHSNSAECESDDGENGNSLPA